MMSRFRRRPAPPRIELDPAPGLAVPITLNVFFGSFCPHDIGGAMSSAASPSSTTAPGRCGTPTADLSFGADVSGRIQMETDVYHASFRTEMAASFFDENRGATDGGTEGMGGSRKHDKREWTIGREKKKGIVDDDGDDDDDNGRSEQVFYVPRVLPPIPNPNPPAAAPTALDPSIPPALRALLHLTTTNADTLINAYPCCTAPGCAAPATALVTKPLCASARANLPRTGECVAGYGLLADGPQVRALMERVVGMVRGFEWEDVADSGRAKRGFSRGPSKAWVKAATTGAGGGGGEWVNLLAAPVCLGAEKEGLRGREKGKGSEGSRDGGDRPPDCPDSCEIRVRALLDSFVDSILADLPPSPGRRIKPHKTGRIFLGLRRRRHHRNNSSGGRRSSDTTSPTAAGPLARFFSFYDHHRQHGDLMRHYDSQSPPQLPHPPPLSLSHYRSFASLTRARARSLSNRFINSPPFATPPGPESGPRAGAGSTVTAADASSGSPGLLGSPGLPEPLLPVRLVAYVGRPPLDLTVAPRARELSVLVFESAWPRSLLTPARGRSGSGPAASFPGMTTVRKQEQGQGQESQDKNPEVSARMREVYSLIAGFHERPVLAAGMRTEHEIDDDDGDDNGQGRSRSDSTSSSAAPASSPSVAAFSCISPSSPPLFRSSPPFAGSSLAGSFPSSSSSVCRHPHDSTTTTATSGFICAICPPDQHGRRPQATTLLHRPISFRPNSLAPFSIYGTPSLPPATIPSSDSAIPRPTAPYVRTDWQARDPESVALRQTLMRLNQRHVRTLWTYPEMTAVFGHDGVAQINELVVPLCGQDPLCEDTARIAAAVSVEMVNTEDDDLAGAGLADRPIPPMLASLWPDLSPDIFLADTVRHDEDDEDGSAAVCGRGYGGNHGGTRSHLRSEDPNKPRLVASRLGECCADYDKSLASTAASTGEDKHSHVACSPNDYEFGLSGLTVADLRRFIYHYPRMADVREFVLERTGIAVTAVDEEEVDEGGRSDLFDLDAHTDTSTLFASEALSSSFSAQPLGRGFASTAPIQLDPESDSETERELEHHRLRRHQTPSSSSVSLLPGTDSLRRGSSGSGGYRRRGSGGELSGRGRGGHDSDGSSSLGRSSHRLWSRRCGSTIDLRHMRHAAAAAPPAISSVPNAPHAQPISDLLASSPLDSVQMPRLRSIFGSRLGKERIGGGGGELTNGYTPPVARHRLVRGPSSRLRMQSGGCKQVREDES